MGRISRPTRLALALAGAALVALLGWAALSGLTESGISALGVATPTPTATVAAPQPPAAPTLLGFEGSDLVWEDNSDNEDGFRVRRSVGGAALEVVATLPANTTRASISEFPEFTLDDPCDFVDYNVVAFNQGVESAPSDTIGISVSDCFGFEPAPPPTLGFPDTGAGRAGGGGGPAPGWPAAAAAAGLALAALGGAVALRGRARS